MKPLVFILPLVVLPMLGFSASIKRKNADLAAERAAKSTIVSYRKRNMNEVDILREKIRLQKKCHCHVKHLPRVGAFILSYPHKNHVAADSLEVNIENGIALEDKVISVLDEDIKLEEIPEDLFFNQQWALNNLENKADINALKGWEEYLSDSIGGSPTGPNVVVAVIDTGVDYNHPELVNMMWRNSGEIEGNGVDDDGNGIIDDVFGADFTDFNNSIALGDPMDHYSHGTHCAGIIGAEENNGIGIAGVASFSRGKIKIMAVKGLSDEGYGTTGSLMASLEYAIAHGAKVSSNSWGSDEPASPLEDKLWSNILQNNLDHIFIAAAGNDNLMLDSTYKPLACGVDEPNLLCVASSTIKDEMSYFSNYGKDLVHVFAPGSDILSTIPNNQYAIMSGTSMATPHVSGLAALVMSMRDNLDGEQVKKLIENSVQKKNVYKDLVSSGGLIDVAQTIIALKTKGIIVYYHYLCNL